MGIATHPWILAGCLGVACCGSTVSREAAEPPAPTEDAPPPAPAPPAPVPPADDPVAVTIPLLGGGTVRLAKLAGTPRMVYVPDPDASGADLAALARWASDVARGGRDPGPVVVLLAVGGDHDRLADAWGIPIPGVYFGWDPQGAVAAKLAIDHFPAVILVDGRGRVTLRTFGTAAYDLDAIARKARALSGAPDW